MMVGSDFGKTCIYMGNRTNKVGIKIAAGEAGVLNENLIEEHDADENDHKRAYEMTCDHELDDTPVGPHSPFAKLPHVNGKILILGSHPDHNTSLHGVEETAVPPYLFREERVHYVLRDGEKEIHQQALRHNFYVDGVHWDQRYARIINLLSEEEVKKGKVLSADCVLMDAKAVWEKGHEKLLEDPWYFVEKPPRCAYK